MSPPAALWRLSLTAPGKTVQAFETALEPFCESSSLFEDEAAGLWRLDAYTRDEPDREATSRALAVMAEAIGAAEPDLSVEAMESRDWLADNLRTFPPIVAGRFFIHGAHFDGTPPVGAIALWIESATAFGSGEHASTAGCLRALNLSAPRRFHRVLDMGCGSGILALAAAKLWRAPVLAADIDVESVRVTAVNARRNGVAPWIRALPSVGYRNPAIGRVGPYDLICANILARSLRAMAGDLARHLAPGGVAVLSGFLARDENLVRSAHRARGLRPVRRITLDGWRTLVLERP